MGLMKTLDIERRNLDLPIDTPIERVYDDIIIDLETQIAKKTHFNKILDGYRVFIEAYPLLIIFFLMGVGTVFLNIIITSIAGWMLIGWLIIIANLSTQYIRNEKNLPVLKEQLIFYEKNNTRKKLIMEID
jgi:hypothetical protein